MAVSFLTPLAALVGVVGVAAVLAHLATRRRSRVVNAALGLDQPGRRQAVIDVGLFASVSALIALACTQPVVSSSARLEGREGAEVYVVMDITRSMLARRAPSEPTRLERAQALAKEIRASVPDVRVGVVSLTDRVLPHLFPTLSANTFAAVVDRAVGIERPPPDRRTQRATSLNALGDLGKAAFYDVLSNRRVAVVLTDGETLPVDLVTLRRRVLETRVAMVFVHVSHPGERVVASDGRPDPTYRPDPTALRSLRTVAGAVEGALYSEAESEEVTAAISRMVGAGALVEQGRELHPRELAPYLIALTGIPLLLLARRRML